MLSAPRFRANSASFAAVERTPRNGNKAGRLRQSLDGRMLIDPFRQARVAVQRETETVPITLHHGDANFREERLRRPFAYLGHPTEVAEPLLQSRAFADRLTLRLNGRIGRAALVPLLPHVRVYEYVDRGL